MTHSARPPLVLAIDDSPVQLRMVQDLLTRKGYAVKTAASSEHALTLLESDVPAVIISDVTMPGMSGHELCRKLKRDLKLRKIPIVLLTGETSPKDFNQGKEAGAVLYIAKPFKPESQLNAVRMLCASLGVSDDSS